jgi:hypothetical protein
VSYFPGNFEKRRRQYNWIHFYPRHAIHAKLIGNILDEILMCVNKYLIGVRGSIVNLNLHGIQGSLCSVQSLCQYIHIYVHILGVWSLFLEFCFFRSNMFAPSSSEICAVDEANSITPGTNE